MSPKEVTLANIHAQFKHFAEAFKNWLKSESVQAEWFKISQALDKVIAWGNSQEGRIAMHRALELLSENSNNRMNDLKGKL